MNSFPDRRQKAPTFDQLFVFLCVVEERGFAAAARHLNRRQSAVSYTISALEAQLGGISLFDRSTRRPTLTEIGQAIVADARRIAREMDGLQANVEGLLSGVEAELSVVLDVMLPSQTLVSVLKEFRLEYPKVSLRIKTEVLGGVPANILNGAARIGISGPLFYQIDGLDQERVGETALLPVAAPHHPLVGKTALIANREARQHTQIVLSDRSDLSRGRDFAVIATDTMRVSDLQAKHWLLLAGLGWGNLPEPLIVADVAKGRLQTLPLAEWQRRPYSFYAVHRSDSPPGPAARRLIELFKEFLRTPSVS